MSMIRIGVVGIGSLGEMHVANVQNHVMDAEVVAVCARHKDRVEEIQKKYNVPHGYTSYDEMLEQEEMDAVMIVTGVTAHKEQCIKAAKKGLHIFCEKPLASSVEECREIEQAVEENKGKVFLLGYMRRSDKAYAEAMRRVRAGEIGDVIIYKGVGLDPASVLGPHIEGVREGKYKPFFVEMASHDADLALWFLGSEMESVYAVGGAYVEKGFADYDDYDNAMAVARFKNGSCAFFQVGRTHNSSHVETEIIGTKGTIRVNNIPDISRLEIFDERGYVRNLEQSFLERWADTFIREANDFVACIKGEKQPEISVYDGAKSMKMVEMMQRAYVENRVVRADE